MKSRVSSLTSKNFYFWQNWNQMDFKTLGQSEDMSDNHFVSKRRQGVSTVVFCFLGMYCCHQATLDAVDSSVFIFWALYTRLTGTSYCLSWSREIDESRRLVIYQTWEFCRIESIQASDLLAFANPWGSASLSSVFVTVVVSLSSWNWNTSAWTRSSVDLSSLCPRGESRKSTSLDGSGFTKLAWHNSFSR